MYLKRKNVKQETHKAVREAINLNQNEGIQIYNPENISILYRIETAWMEQMTEFQNIQSPFQKRTLSKSKLIIKWWEN